MTPAQQEAIQTAMGIIRAAFDGERVHTFRLVWKAGKRISFSTTRKVPEPRRPIRTGPVAVPPPPPPPPPPPMRTQEGEPC